MANNPHRQLAAALSDVAPLLPTPWDIAIFVKRLGHARGRRITLVPWDFVDGQPSGLWIPAELADYIFYAAAASPSRGEQIIGHELGHMLLGHSPALAGAPDGLIQSLAPSLTPDLARRVLARTGYEEPYEAQAEAFGTQLIHAGRRKRPPLSDDELGRLTDALR